MVKQAPAVSRGTTANNAKQHNKMIDTQHILADFSIAHKEVKEIVDKFTEMNDLEKVTKVEGLYRVLEAFGMMVFNSVAYRALWCIDDMASDPETDELDDEGAEILESLELAIYPKSKELILSDNLNIDIEEVAPRTFVTHITPKINS